MQRDPVTSMFHDAQCIALRQLETALRLYFECEDYYSVITMAGASEEIFGRLLSERNSNNSMAFIRKDVSAVHEKLFEQDLTAR